MLARGPAVVLDARATGRAVPAFTVYTLESIRAVYEAAERTRLPVILQGGSSSYRETSRSMLAAAALAAARDASVPIGSTWTTRPIWRRFATAYRWDTPR